MSGERWGKFGMEERRQMWKQSNGSTRFRWLLTCSIMYVLLAARWNMPAMAQAASTMDVPVGIQRSCMGSTTGAYHTAARVSTRAQASGAQLSINRVEGPPGTQLILSGSGWPAGANIAIDLIGFQANGQSFVGVKDISHATATSGGSFHTETFAAPYQHSCTGGGYGEPNSVVRYAAHTADDTVEAEAQFHYLPAPVVQTVSSNGNGQAVTPGAQITVMGLHWEPEVLVMLSGARFASYTWPLVPDNKLTPHNQDTTQVRTDTTGSFQVNMRMPTDLAPRTGYVITAASNGPRFGTLTIPSMTLLALPVKMPTLTLDRSEGTSGSSVRLTGTHWVPGDVVQLEYCRDGISVFGVADRSPRCHPVTTQSLGEARVGQDGHFQAQVKLPTDARLGVVTIQARVPEDVFGLLVYAQGQTFTIVRPAVPWTVEHPLLTRVAVIGGASVLGALLLAAAAYLMRLRSAMREGACYTRLSHAGELRFWHRWR